MNRRYFIETLGVAGILLGTFSLISCLNTVKRRNVLILGGTDFLGSAIVKACLERGHKVTLFNRGITNPKLFSELPLIKGDRERGPKCYTPLQDQFWDVIIDVWPQKSKLVDEATLALKQHAKHYVFISSIAVYKDFAIAGRNERFYAIAS